jgi:diguanylate cyclase (GGDEF)-like protein
MSLLPLKARTNRAADPHASSCARVENRATLALAALDHLQKAVAVVAPDDGILYHNARFSEFFPEGELPEELRGILEGLRRGSCNADTTQIIEYGDRKLNVRTVKLAQGLLLTADDISERLAEQERIVEQARTDPLTQLGNRLMFRERVLAGIEQPGNSAAILLIDLDRFKAINDSLGHEIGDTLLKLIAARIRSTLKSGEIAARLRGDEFAIYQPGQQQPNAAARLAERLIDLLGRAYLVEGHVLHIGASIGISMTPADGGRYEDILRNADLAMYHAKQDGRRTFRFFEPGMRDAIRLRREMESRLRRALSLRQFHLDYQPQLNLRSGRITGFEALLRWQSEAAGLVSPLEFVPLAEELGLIIPIGEWVIREACRQAAGWTEPLNVAVNVSAIQFESQNLLPAIVTALANSGLPPSRLELEVTESVLFRDHQSALKVLHSIRDLGVRVSMDDFGTGYSSLSYLGSFPFDKLKIDQSFVRGRSASVSGTQIVRAIAALGRSLGMSITAEGVETQSQLSAVTEAGCTDVQGYLISRPMAADQIEPFLARAPQWGAARANSA